jgi:hypothetical protein
MQRIVEKEKARYEQNADAMAKLELAIADPQSALWCDHDAWKWGDDGTPPEIFFRLRLLLYEHRVMGGAYRDRLVETPTLRKIANGQGALAALAREELDVYDQQLTLDAAGAPAFPIAILADAGPGQPPRAAVVDGTIVRVEDLFTSYGFLGKRLSDAISAFLEIAEGVQTSPMRNSLRALKSRALARRSSLGAGMLTSPPNPVSAPRDDSVVVDQAFEMFEELLRTFPVEDTFRNHSDKVRLAQPQEIGTQSVGVLIVPKSWPIDVFEEHELRKEEVKKVLWNRAHDGESSLSTLLPDFSDERDLCDLLDELALGVSWVSVALDMIASYDAEARHWSTIRDLHGPLEHRASGYLDLYRQWRLVLPWGGELSIINALSKARASKRRCGPLKTVTAIAVTVLIKSLSKVFFSRETMADVVADIINGERAVTSSRGGPVRRLKTDVGTDAIVFDLLPLAGRIMRAQNIEFPFKYSVTSIGYRSLV